MQDFKFHGRGAAKILTGISIFVVGGLVGYGVGSNHVKPETRREVKVVVVPRKYEKLDGRRFLIYDYERINLDSLLRETK